MPNKILAQNTNLTQDMMVKKIPSVETEGITTYEKHQTLIRFGFTHFQSFTWDNHPKMNLQHKTQETNVQFFVFISDTNIDVRDKVKFNKLVSKNSLCHIV
jgi:hypothetical protein